MKLGKRMKQKIAEGTRGAISILLCLVLAPFLSISLMLVEVSRYQQAVETLNEVNNSAALSTLANLDGFLEKRFGLFGTTQASNVGSTYNKYLQLNWGALGEDATLGTSSVDFESSLSLANQEVLKQQILEFSELTVSTEFAVDTLDLTQLISTLEKLGDLEGITNTMKATAATADVAKATVDLITYVKDTITSLQAYADQCAVYYEAHQAFVTASTDLQDTIKKEMDADSDLAYPKDITPVPTQSTSTTTPTPTPAPTKTSVYDNANVKTKMDTLEVKRAAYESACKTLADKVSAIKTVLTSIVSSLETVDEKIKKLQEIAKENSGTNETNVSVVADTSGEIYEEVMNNIASALGDFVKQETIDGMDDSVDNLRAMGLLLANFDATTITGETTAQEIESKYGLIAIGVPDMVALNQALIDGEASLTGGDGASVVNMIMDMVDSLTGLFELDVFYDSKQDAILSETYYQKLSQMIDTGPLDPSPAEIVLGSISEMVTAAKTLTSALVPFDIFKVFEAAASVGKAVVKFFEAIIKWFTDFCQRVVDIVSGGWDGLYQSLMVCGYSAYNFPNRTTKRKGGSALTGFSYSNIASADPSSSNGPAGDLNALVELLKELDKSTSEDITFCGAELEYILMGTKSEIANQMCTFMSVFLLRMLPNVAALLIDGQVKTMVVGSTIGGPLVFVLVLLLESLVDTIMLVNGGSSYLIKRYVYCTPLGVPKLIEDLIKVTPLSDELKDKLNKIGKPDAKKPTASIGDFVKDGIGEIDYKDHVMFLLMFTCSQEDDVLPRIAKLIQMESESYYLKAAAPYTFDIRKAYAFVNFNIDATLNPLFSVEKLSKIGYPYKQKIYRGY